MTMLANTATMAAWMWLQTSGAVAPGGRRCFGVGGVSVADRGDVRASHAATPSCSKTASPKWLPEPAASSTVRRSFS